ncbi:hypothetical protein Cgig2_009587 [Carnegiea gigantea]|uniref:DUF4408 domain-containing protein n=1 Tax=Carnegiea gigantea TaxID=171969 RepID=A0A9Q1KAF8_9CARY|nr:hypothetical protein Cgig2_009587 [Carnegiea gigantea]
MNLRGQIDLVAENNELFNFHISLSSAMDSSLLSFCRRIFRLVEVCVLLVFLSWFSTRLPFAIKISGEYFWRFSALILSPASIFLLGNAIVVTLLAKSGLFSSKCSSSIDNAVAEFYRQLRSVDSDEITPALEEEVVYQDKEIICEENTKIANPNENVGDDDEEEMIFPEAKRNCQRNQSENLSRENDDTKTNQKLRRSETDIRRNLAGVEEVSLKDDVSSEEFRRTIEDFIARQVRFHREERLAVVLHGQA